MRDRHNRIDTRVQRTAGGAAAVVFCLAGAAAGMAQPATQPGIRNPMAQPAPLNEKVKVDEHMVVDLHVNDEDLANVLQMLSIQSQKNIVTSRNVSAMVTANLYGVTFYEALDAILHVNGYGYIERGNFIYVYTLDELTTIEAAQRQRVWRVVRMNYISSVDAAEFVKPLLSENGQIKTNGRPGSFADMGSVSGEDFASESTMLIFDFEENLAEIERVLAEIDTRPKQVHIEATILQTALSEANAFGIDFSILGDMDFSDFINLGGPLKVVDAMIGGSEPTDNKGQGIVSTAGNTSGASTMKMGIVSNDVAAFLRLLDEVSDTQILSRPNMLVLNRTTGRVLVGRKVGFLSTTSTDTATTQTVEFLDTGTQLIVRPFIAADGMIRMDLKPKVSEAVIRNTTTAGGQAVTIPDEISNELTTTVLVRDGQTIVLGGLFRESTHASRRQVPLVGDLPIIGAAFRGHDDEVQRSEVIFMITPTIMSDTLLVEHGRRGSAAVDHVRAGSREGLLLWSRDKRTQQMLVQAFEMAQNGDREGALYRVNRALSLSPMQADAIALREHLLQQRTVWPTRSLQHEIVTGEFERAAGGGQHSTAIPFRNVPVSRTGPAVSVEIDAVHGITWFNDPIEVEQSTPANQPPAPKQEQAQVPDSPISSNDTPERNRPLNTGSVQQPTTQAVAAPPPVASPPPQQPAPTTTAQGSFPKAEPAATAAPSSQPVITSESQARTAQQIRHNELVNITVSEPSTLQANTSTTSRQMTVQSSGPVYAEVVSSDFATPAPATTPSAAGARPATSTPVAESKSTSTPAKVTQAPAAASPEAPSQLMWSSALAAALAESGDVFAGIEPAASTQSITKPATTSNVTITPGMAWDPEGNSHSGGVMGIFASYYTMWDLFRSYSERGPGPWKDSAVTSVPTDGSSRRE